MLMWLNPTPSFMLNTPCRKQNDNKKEMEGWMEILKNTQNMEHFESTQHHVDHFSGIYN